MKLGMSLLMIATLSCAELTSPTWLCGQAPKYNLGTSGPTAPDGAGETGGSSAAANTGASDFPYVFPKTSITLTIDSRKKQGLPPQCTPYGLPCASGSSPCCPGLACVLHLDRGYLCSF
jgi:hypothetical protein